MQLKEIVVRPVTQQEQADYHKLMQRHHYLGSVRPVGETLHYVATWRTQWIALLGFSSAALKDDAWSTLFFLFGKAQRGVIARC
ncbi:Druantia anti-phage system protein DruA [Nitrosomonas sp. Nm51]|uniref:Druantia anti-phage system protein DruA n=1 Tax=Nitrosomonas sp. Nm51 TaxID=133720 RepID=UPI000B897A30|nr:Druantia anti-phage system protein DruA [Nitrosomonas sp. Nm51]